MMCKCGNIVGYNSHFSGYYCSACGQFFEDKEIKTNEDWFRSLSIEEIAEQFTFVIFKALNDAGYCDDGTGATSYQERLIQWFAEPYEEDGDVNG